MELSNDIAKASLHASMYKVIKRKSPEKRVKLYDMIFDYLYMDIEPSEDDEFYDLFLAWKPQMDFELNAKLSGKKGRLARDGKNNAKNDTFFSTFSDPKQGFEKPCLDNVNENENVNVNAHENVNVVQNDFECVGEVQEKQEDDIQKKWHGFEQKAFGLITEHNKSASYAHKMPISKDFFSFIQKECRELIAALKNECPEDILQALKNYLEIAKGDTWKTTFSIANFIKDYARYSDKDFEILPFLKNQNQVAQSVCDVPKQTPEQLEQQLLTEMQGEKHFIKPIFEHYKDEWVSRGCPLGKQYFVFQEEKALSGYGQKLKADFLIHEKGA